MAENVEENVEENDFVENLDDIGDVKENLEGDLNSDEEAEASAPIAGKGQNRNLDLILDIPLTVTVELGKTKMLINDLLQLSQGSVVELTKLVGEPLEVLVNQKLIARGEVVVVNEKFGVRLTDIVSTLERVQSLT